ncbi:MAG: dihydrodipicolinate synthase family protein [Alphaproteobacteria bacterium]|nr:dihydrodipicolinate synthase family protein [Alphaproteobacteria bacterium]
MSQSQPQGVYCASLTPMDAELAPDLPRLIRHSKWLLASGCDGLGILGTTGEANSLSLSQRRTVIETACRELPRDKLMPGVGSCAVADAIELTRTAIAGGVKTVLCLPPFYYKGIADAGVEAFFDRIVQRIADPGLRIYLYNFPQLTGYAFQLDSVARMRDRHGPIVAGMKDSSGDFANMKKFAEGLPGFRVFAGTEQYLADILAVGGVGCITATANVTAPWCAKVYAAKGEARTQAQAVLTALRLALQAKPLVPCLKGVIGRFTGDPIWNHMAPPMMKLAAADIDAVTANLAKHGLTEMKLAA